jgi:hypothetical protein
MLLLPDKTWHFFLGGLTLENHMMLLPEKHGIFFWGG